MDVNLKGVWLCMKYEIPEMIKRGGGAIVNTSAEAGLQGSLNFSFAASKHGVIGLTKSAALGYGNQGVRVNAVCPGWIRHSSVEPFLADPELKAIVQKMEPAGRLGHPGCLPVGLHRRQRTRRIHLKAVGEDSPGCRDTPAYEHHHDEGYPTHR